MSNQANKPSSLPGWVDGRSYNYVVRDVDGNVKALDGSTKNKPDVAQWRQNMAKLDNTIPYFAGEIGSTSDTSYKCNLADATTLIGCIVGNTTCTIGFAGREAAGNSVADDLQEPFRVSTAADATTAGTYYDPSNANIEGLLYPLSRDLFISAIGGFENITADCLARGGSTNYCNDELKIAQEFYNNTTTVQNACTTAGFLAKPTTGPLKCIGAMDAKATNGLCGAPADQTANPTACEPH
jgi:hypothetical protein